MKYLVYFLVFSLFAMSSSSPLAAQRASQGFDCGFCEFLMFTIYGYIAENSTQSEVTAIVDKICNYIPTQYTEVCTQFIAIYAPDIIMFIMRHETPEAICKQIGLCNATSLQSMQQCGDKIDSYRLCKASRFLKRRQPSLSVLQAVENTCELMDHKKSRFCNDAITREVISVLTENDGMSCDAICTSTLRGISA